MKAYRIELLVIDHDDIGIDNVVELLQNAKYINPQWLSSQEADIGEWHDDHPLNRSATFRPEVDRLFKGR